MYISDKDILVIGVNRDGSIGLDNTGKPLDNGVTIAVFPATFSQPMREALNEIDESRDEHTDGVPGLTLDTPVVNTARIIREFSLELEKRVKAIAERDGIEIPEGVYLGEAAARWHLVNEVKDAEAIPSEVRVAELPEGSTVLYAAYADGLIVRTTSEKPIHGAAGFAVVPVEYDQKVLTAITALSDSEYLHDEEDGYVTRAKIPNMDEIDDSDPEQRRESVARVIGFGDVIGQALEEIEGDVPEDALFGLPATRHIAELKKLHPEPPMDAAPINDTIH